MTPRAWLLFTGVSVVWGVPYFFIKVAVEDGVPPAFVAWSRVALGAAVLLPLAWRRGALRGLGGRWGPIAAYTACEVAVPFLLIALGEQHICWSLAAHPDRLHAADGGLAVGALLARRNVWTPETSSGTNAI